MEELLEAGELTPSLTLIAVSIIDREDEFAQLSADLQDRYGTALIAYREMEDAHGQRRGGLGLQ